jgi:hypothetical protein
VSGENLSAKSALLETYEHGHGSNSELELAYTPRKSAVAVALESDRLSATGGWRYDAD